MKVSVNASKKIIGKSRSLNIFGTIVRVFFLRCLYVISWLSWSKFQKNIQDPESSQYNTLKNILQRSAETERGKHLGVTGSETYQQFAEKVPLCIWDDIEQYVLDQRKLDRNQICPDSVSCYETTSGSSGAKKNIPYNRALLASFQKMFLIWIYDLLRFGPKLNSARVWWSISPQFGEQALTANGIKDGLADDSEYLSGITGWIVKQFLCVDPRVQGLKNPDNFYLAVAAYLAATKDLEIISIWNPTMFFQILKTMKDNQDQIKAVLDSGSLVLEGQLFELRSNQRRAIEFKFALDRGWKYLWPQLKLISTWDSANAGMSANRLRKEFPGTLIQGKGLLATEAPMTIPMLNCESGTVPLISEVFFEYRDINSQKIVSIAGVILGQTYEVILSQKAGLLRYQTGDLVTVSGYYGDTPTFDFLCRSGQVFDLVGEKLNQIRIQKALIELGYNDSWLGIPCQALNSRKVPGYKIVLKRQVAALDLDKKLTVTYHYGLARRLKQLEQCEVIVEPDLDQLYSEFCRTKKSMTPGDIKTPGLITNLAEASQLEKFLRPAQGKQTR